MIFRYSIFGIFGLQVIKSIDVCEGNDSMIRQLVVQKYRKYCGRSLPQYPSKFSSVFCHFGGVKITSVPYKALMELLVKYGFAG